MMIVLILGVGFAALRESNATWDTGIFSITLGVLLISILLAIYRADKRRAFWLGFALFGSAYLGLTLVRSIESRLITTKTLAFLRSTMPRSIPDKFAGPYDYPIDAGSNPAGNQAWSLWNSLLGTSQTGSTGTTGHFIRIGHSLLAVVAALLGGLLSKYLHTKNSQDTSAPVAAPVSISNNSGA